MKTKASKLSEGYQKKLNIVLSLINFGEEIILDEPYNFLDQKAVDSLSNYLKNILSFNKTIIITAHQRDLFNDFNHQTLVLECQQKA